MSFNGNNMTPLGGNARAGDNALDRNAPMGWAYQSKTDDLNAVQATGYFDTFHQFLVAGQFIYVSLLGQKAFITVQSVDKVLKQVVIDTGTVGGGDAHIPNAVIEVFTEEDFGVFGEGGRQLIPGTTYILMNDIPVVGPLNLQGSDVAPVVIRSNHPSTNALISTESENCAFFFNSTNGDSKLFLQNINIVDQTGLLAGRPFIKLVGTAQNNSSLQMDACTVNGFYNGTDADTIRASRSILENIFISMTNTVRWVNSNTLILIDAVLTADHIAMGNRPETTNTTLRISSKDPLVGSQITLDSIRMPFNAMEVHSNLNQLSTVLINSLFLDDLSTGTPGEDIFFNDETGTVSAVADDGGGRILCTAAGHNLLDGDTVTHDTDFTDANYQGDFIVFDVIEDVSYKVVAPFGATDTGTWTNLSLTQADPKVISRGNDRIMLPNSMTVSSIRSTKTLVVAGVQNISEPIVDSVDPQSGDFVIDTEERITTDDQSGLATFKGLTETDVDVKFSFDFVPSSGVAQDLEFTIFQNGNPVLSSILSFNSGVVSTMATIGTILRLAPGDTVQLFKTNRTNSTNTDISNIRRLITSAG